MSYLSKMVLGQECKWRYLGNLILPSNNPTPVTRTLYYYELQCFSNNQSFSIINCNIRSLSKNFDNLTNMLSNLYFSFSLIGLTETKIKSDQTQIVNTDLPGYHYSYLNRPSLIGEVLLSILKIICILKFVLTYHLPLKTLRHYGLKSIIILIPIYFVASFIVTLMVILEILLII